MNKYISHIARQLIATHSNQGLLQEPIVLSHPEIECGVIITPSAKVPNTYQASYFNAASWMLFDNTFVDLADAVETVLTQGYEEDGVELFERLAERRSKTVH